MRVTAPRNVTDVTAELVSRAPGRAVIPEPIVTVLNELINANAYSAILVTESGITNDVSCVYENALPPIDVTDDGMDTLVKAEP